MRDRRARTNQYHIAYLVVLLASCYNSLPIIHLPCFEHPSTSHVLPCHTCHTYNKHSHIMPSANPVPRTLYDKVLQDHIVDQKDDSTILLYIDRHLVHEVTSPQAFEGLRNANRRVRRPDCTLATTDHVSKYRSGRCFHMLTTLQECSDHLTKAPQKRRDIHRRSRFTHPVRYPRRQCESFRPYLFRIERQTSRHRTYHRP